MAEVSPLPLADLFPFPPFILVMNIVIWNCRGASNPSFQSYVHNLVQMHSPAIMIITETKISGLRAKNITDQLQFDGAIHANNIGFSGGLWVLWDSTQVEISELSSSEQEIHTLVRDLSSNSSWLMSAIYASPRYAERRLLWENLSQVAELHTLPWIIAGDFNEVLTGEDKFGGLPINISRAIKFQECLNSCRLFDLGFSGPRFTWSNRQPLSHLIQERIDRVFVNTDWNEFYPEANVRHLERSHSDHCPIVLSLHHNQGNSFPRPFRFQPMWLSHPDFPDLVKEAWARPSNLPSAVTSFTARAKCWNKEHFGNIFHRKRRICARLKGVQSALGVNPNNFLIDLEKSLLKELSSVASLEAEFWSMKARISWVVEGDRNTAFFHNSTLIRRRRNRISNLKDRMGNWLTGDYEIANFIRQGFLELFTTSQCHSHRQVWQPPFWRCSLQADDILKLELPVTDAEILTAL